MTNEAEVFDALKYHVEVDEYGDRRYYNALGQLHRDVGPAIEAASGDRYWYRNGKLHREDGPAVIYQNGTRKWLLNGEFHREDGPAIEWGYGGQAWYLHNKELSEEKFLASMEDTEDI